MKLCSRQRTIRRNLTGRSRQQGITLVEFSILASVFLLIMFAVIEIGIFAFQLQAMNDISRRTARVAVVCPVGTDVNIKSLAFTEQIPTGMFATNQFDDDNIEIDYLNNSGIKVETPFDNQGDIHYVRVRIVDFNYGFSGLLNFLGDNGTLSVPQFETILPAESLGNLRIDGSDEKTTCI